jgi:hypothetical protein
MAGGATATILPLVSTTSKATCISLQIGEIVHEVVVVGQRPSTGEADSSPQALCSIVCRVVTPTLGVTYSTCHWVSESRNNKGYAFVNILSSWKSIGGIPWVVPGFA